MSTTGSYIAAILVWGFCTIVVYQVLGIKSKRRGNKPLDRLFGWVKSARNARFCKLATGWIMLILSPLTVVIAVAAFLALVIVSLGWAGIDRVNNQLD